MQVLQKLGVCLEEHWPYKPHNRDVTPFEKHAAEALDNRINKWRR
jgi:hypothetical protein